MSVEYLLLGPVQLLVGGEQVELKRRQERLLLAILLLEPGKTVAAERLIELLWPDELPGNPRRALQVYASRLRSVVTAADPETRLEGGPEGYAVQGPTGRTDIERFNELTRQAGTIADPEQRRTVLLEALQLWRGPALADVASEDVRRRLSAGLDEARWAAQELRVATELELGHHQELLPELAELNSAEPLREQVAAAHMLALYRSGRQAESLSVYADLVRRLADELGTDPSAELRELQVSILRQDPALDLEAADETPRELPADIGVLMGRDELLAELAAELSRSRPDGVPAVVCLYGAAGTGKSATAIRLAHRLAAKYQDGQLFARLQDVSGDPVSPRLVLGQLLRSLGVDGGALPETVEERASLLRSRLAGKSVLLLLDDAVDAGQLRSLLPAGGRCAVIVASRQPILGLEDATHREIRPLSDQTSAELLAELSGLTPEALTEVVPYCVGLPLALRIVGARLGLIREDVADVVKALASDTERLDYLVAGDRAVRASLDLTVQVASADAQRLFALLPVIGADEFSAWVAAPLLGYSEPHSRQVLDSLLAFGLLQPRRMDPPTYGFHSLVRSYASELLSRVAAEDRDLVERRYLSTVLRLLTLADEHVNHGIAAFVQLHLGDGGQPLPATEVAATAGGSWLDQEIGVIRAAVLRAVDTDPRLAGVLALRFNGYLAVRDERDIRENVLEVARVAVSDLGEPALEADLDRSLFGAYAQRGVDRELLAEVVERGLRAAEAGGHAGQRIAMISQLTWLTLDQRDFRKAMQLSRERLDLIGTGANSELEAMRAKSLDLLAHALSGLNRGKETLPLRRESCQLSPPGSRILAIRLVLLAETLFADDRGLAHRSELYVVLAEAREIVERLGDQLGRAHVDVHQARLQILAGELEPAAGLLDRAAATFEARPDQWGEVVLRVGRAWLELAAGRSEAARGLLHTGIRESAAADYQTGVEEFERQLVSAGLSASEGQASDGCRFNTVRDNLAQNGQ
jgi:DNA-binding SARP family transcriptional activator